VTQNLFNISVIAESLPRIWERKPQRASELLTQIQQSIKGAGAELRFLLYELRPEMLERNTLLELIQRLIDSVKARKKITLSLQFEGGDCQLPNEVKIALFRMAQEGLNNIIKHAQATEANVYLYCQSRKVELRLRDNGQGFDTQQISSGLGLVGMRERALKIGATFELRSAPGQGTELILLWEAQPSSTAVALSASS